MKNLITTAALGLIILAIGFACGYVEAPAKQPVSPHMEAQNLSGGITRLENSEVICYTIKDLGISCHFKRP